MLETVTMYITMQPCHKSVSGTGGTKENWRCCETLIDLAANQVKGVEIEIKPTYLSKDGWKSHKEKRRTLYKNAEDGIKDLMRIDNITLTKMEPSDWTFFWNLVNKPKGFVIEEQKEGLRKKLVDEIGEKLQEWQDVVKGEAKKKQEMEVVTKGKRQLRTDEQPKSKK